MITMIANCLDNDDFNAINTCQTSASDASSS